MRVWLLTRELVAPLVILVAAYLLVPHVSALPASLAGLREHGPYLVIALGIALSIAFRRGRVLLALLTLTAAQLARHAYLHPGAAADAAYTVFAALCLFVPFNFAALSLIAERGIFNRHLVQRAAVLLAQMTLVAWLVRHRHNAFAETIYATLVETRLLAKSPLPQIGMLALAIAFGVVFVRWFARRSAIDLGLAGALAAFALAAHGVTTPTVFETYLAAAALILVVAVMQDTFRMAFRDDLTGLLSRRALSERLASLPRRYTIAMLDVDRFKGLNDRFGHDVGDQVLKMVAARLARVGGGGTVYRYGGEEFSIVFPGKSVEEALPHLETLRRDVADYRLELRHPGRSEAPGTEKKRRSEREGRSVAVTISIGVAEVCDGSATPQEVIQAADRALYRAKNRGRNQVSR